MTLLPLPSPGPAPLDPREQALLDEFLTGHRDDLVAFRRHLHAHPELSYAEHESTDFVAERLAAAGLEPRRIEGGFGLVCDVGEGDGPVVALRADLDALAMEDEKDVAYRSKRPGVAHACGHDVHTTVVLGAGLALARALTADGPPGRVRLVFEAAEEVLPSGAVGVVASGALDEVSAIYGLHCDPKLDVGHIGVRAGAITAATDMVEIELRGPGGHTARPQLTVDLVEVAGRLASQLPALARAGAADLGEMLLVFGMLRTGDAANVIPAHALLRGTARTPDKVVWEQAGTILDRAVAAALDGSGATWDLRHRRGTPPVVNDEAETERLAAVAGGVLGADRVVESPQSFGGDSFAWYLDEVPGTYARLGVHDPAWPDRLDLHSSSFDVHEGAIDVGVRVLVSTALAALRDRSA